MVTWNIRAKGAQAKDLDIRPVIRPEWLGHIGAEPEIIDPGQIPYRIVPGRVRPQEEGHCVSENRMPRYLWTGQEENRSRQERREIELSFLDPIRQRNRRRTGKGIGKGASETVSGTTINSPSGPGSGTGTMKEDISPRTWILFYLICLVAILWATFLLVREEMVWLSFALVIIAAGSGMFLFIHNIKLRTVFFFYLICLVAILWAVFLIVRMEMVWVSMFLLLISACITIFAYFLCDHHLSPGVGSNQNYGPVTGPGNPDNRSSGDPANPVETKEK